MAPVFEDVIEEVGGMGKFQVFLILAVSGCKFAMAWGVLLMTFGGVTPDWWCVQNEVNRTSSLYNQDNSSYQVCVVNDTSCSEIQYARNIKTVISEFDLVCDREQLVSVIINIQLASGFVFTPIVGHAADIIGRKKTLLFLLLIHIVFCVASIFSPGWEVFAFMRFMIGGVSCGIHILDTSLPIEFTGRKWRSWVPGFPSFGLGAACFALAAYLLNDWKHLSIATAVTMLPFLVGTLFIPESLRWLLLHGKVDEAKRITKRIASINGRPPPDLTMVEAVTQTLTTSKTEKSYIWLDLFRTRQMIKQTFITGQLWFTVGFALFGVTFGVVKFSGNLYINMFINGLVEIPATVMSIGSNNKIGRRCTIFWGMLVTGLAALAVVPVSFLGSVQAGHAIVALAMTSKLASTFTWQTLKLYSAEIAPTVVRYPGLIFYIEPIGLLKFIGSAMSAAFIAGRIGSMIGVQLIFVDMLNGSIMYLITAVCTCISAILIWLLPETKKSGIPDTIESIEVTYNARQESNGTTEWKEMEAMDTTPIT